MCHTAKLTLPDARHRGSIHSRAPSGPCFLNVPLSKLSLLTFKSRLPFREFHVHLVLESPAHLGHSQLGHAVTALLAASVLSHRKLSVVGVIKSQPQQVMSRSNVCVIIDITRNHMVQAVTSHGHVIANRSSESLS